MPLYDTGLLTHHSNGVLGVYLATAWRPSSGVTVGDLGTGPHKSRIVGSWIGRHASDIADDPHTIVGVDV